MQLNGLPKVVLMPKAGLNETEGRSLMVYRSSLGNEGIVRMRSGTKWNEAYMISLMFANLPYGYIVFYGAPIKAS